MGASFRASMSWLHTWAGVTLGALLFGIFWMGTLSVFDREIDRWMMPDTRLSLPQTAVDLDRVVATANTLLPADTKRWQIRLPTQREPVIWLRYQTSDGTSFVRHLDPQSGALLVDQGTWAGTGFIFPFHFSLHLRWRNLGVGLVGLAGMTMLCLLVSGIAIHRKIFVELFTFRPDRQLPRSSLDLHNLTGVLALPFHFGMTLSGLIIFFAIYFPTVISAVYQGDRASFSREAFGAYQRDAMGRPGELASVNAMARAASQMWDGAAPYSIQVWHPGDAKSYVEIRRNLAADVSRNLDLVVLDGSTGTILHTHTATPIIGVQRFIVGMHFIQFEHWTLRWIYFALGLAGCVTIGTGYIYWLETRRKRCAAHGRAGFRAIESLAIGAITGILVATLAFFISNRLLPLQSNFLGMTRHALEIAMFYLAWSVAFIHAWARCDRAWQEQCWAISALAVVAVALNAATTGDHLFRSLLQRDLWPVAGMDTLLLACAAIAICAAFRMKRKPAVLRRA